MSFAAALAAKERFAGQSSELTWLTGILNHKIMDHFRRAKRLQTDQDAAGVGITPAVDFLSISHAHDHSQGHAHACSGSHAQLGPMPAEVAERLRSRLADQ